MDYKKIIENIGKYQYVLVVGKKTGILGSDNKSSIAKKEALKKIKPKSDKLDGLLVVKLKLSKVNKKLLKQNEESKIKVIGGPIEVNIDLREIKKGKLIELKNYRKYNKLYITDKFLQKNKKINKKTIKIISSAVFKKKLSSALFVVNTIDKLIK